MANDFSGGLAFLQKQMLSVFLPPKIETKEVAWLDSILKCVKKDVNFSLIRVIQADRFLRNIVTVSLMPFFFFFNRVFF